MQLFLPILYTAIFVWFIFRLRTFQDGQLHPIFFASVFIVKVLLGCLYIYIFPGGDSYMYYDDANLFIYPNLWTHPLKYLYLTFAPNGGSIPQFVHPEVMAMGYWGDTSDYMVVRFNALVRIFSFGNFYVHAVFMAFVSLLGLVWLHRACCRASGSLSLPVTAAVFLIPSVLFWGSGVHKEGLLIFALGWFIYGSVLLVENFSGKNLVIFFTGAALTYFVRNYVFLMLLPGMVAFFFTYKNYLRIRFLLPLLYLVIFGAVILLPLFGGMNFAEVIAFKQAQFKAIEAGTTQIQVKDFKPSWTSLVANLPQALKNSLLGPFFVKPVKAIHYMVIAENFLLLLSALLVPFFSGRPRPQPFMLMCLLFSISLLALIGYIVPNVGAIVRYRSIALPFLFIFLFTGKKQ